MSRIGITGHTALAADTSRLVGAALRLQLAGLAAPLIGVTCLARGADQLFARIVLELGGQVEILLPATDYRQAMVPAADVELFDELVARARWVRTLPYRTACPESYRAASHALVRRVDALVAVWDGRPQWTIGGTADTVAAARGAGIPVMVVWPTGSSRCPD